MIFHKRVHRAMMYIYRYWRSNRSKNEPSTVLKYTDMPRIREMNKTNQLIKYLFWEKRWRSLRQHKRPGRPRVGNDCSSNKWMFEHVGNFLLKISHMSIINKYCTQEITQAAVKSLALVCAYRDFPSRERYWRDSRASSYFTHAIDPDGIPRELWWEEKKSKKKLRKWTPWIEPSQIFTKTLNAHSGFMSDSGASGESIWELVQANFNIRPMICR